MRLYAIPAVLACAMGLGGTAVADEPEQVFQAAYGEELAKVLATAQFADDLALARRIMDGARSTANNGLAALLCDKAAELAGRAPDGHALAIEALALMAERSPDSRPAALSKMLDVHRRQFVTARPADKRGAGEALARAASALADVKAGEEDWLGAVRASYEAMNVSKEIRSNDMPELQTRWENFVRRERIQRQIDQKKAALKINPDDMISRQQLVLLYVVDLDNPAGAAEHLVPGVLETLRTYVPLAAQPIVQVAGPVLLELGDWYLRLAEGAANDCKPAMYRRAIAYYSAFLDKRPEGEAERLKAQSNLKKAQENLAVLEPKPSVAKSPDATRPQPTDQPHTHTNPQDQPDRNRVYIRTPSWWRSRRP